MSDSVDFPRAWMFHNDKGQADGATFVGRFTGVLESANTAYGDKPVAQFIHEETGETFSIWMFNQALLDQISKLAPEAGELVRIDYHGEKKSKSSGRNYKSFKATAPERPSASLSWGDLAVEDDEDE